MVDAMAIGGKKALKSHRGAVGLMNRADYLNVIFPIVTLVV